MRHPSATDTARFAMPWRAVMLSLGLHAVLVAGVSMAPRPAPVPSPTALSMEFSLAPERAEKAREAEPDATIHDPEPDPVAAHESAPATPEPSLEPADSDRNETRDAAPDPAAARPEIERATERESEPSRLRTRILEQIASQPAGASDSTGDPGAAQLPWDARGDSIPGLPGQRGWLSSHVGRVQAESRRWQSSDGSQRARHVLADGTVVCTQRRAPTFDEMMHPWKAAVVTLASVCGRERPPAPDFSDPRIQPPPTRSVQPLSGN